MSSGRRIWLRAATGAVAAVPLGQNLGSARAQPATDAGGAFFSPSQARFVAAASDRLIPQDDFPSASQAGVLDYIDRQLAGEYGQGARMYLLGPHSPGTPEQGYQLPFTPAQVYQESLQALLADSEGASFVQRPAQQQDAFLKQLEAGAWMLGRIPSSVFFETLLSNVVEGYFADPIYGGNRNMAGWKMIGFPGAYANFAQWVGRHNVLFNRAPVGIAGLHSGGEGHGHDPRVPASARPSGRGGR